MKITILTDNPNSWMLPYVDLLKSRLDQDEVYHVYDSAKVMDGDILFMLSCERIVNSKILSRNKNNIVVHPSKLPKGRGWSPLAWQILEGSNNIPFSLFEATEGVDEGPVYIIDYLKLKGTELNEEIKDLQGKKVVEMCVRYRKGKYEPIFQKGEASYYPKRTLNHSELDIDKSLREQFNLLRVVDNEKYPAYFYINEVKYTIKVSKV